MMIKKTFAMVAVLLFSVSCTGLPSVCDNKTEESKLCDVAEKYDVRMEDAFFGIRAANAVIIHFDGYTKSQAQKVLIDMRALFESPVTYIAAWGEIGEITKEYPDMIEFAKPFAEAFVDTRIMLRKDRAIMVQLISDLLSDIE
jgi:hypothetical protein